MTALRPELPPLPDRLKGLPVDERGYPVPRFVAWVDGKPDFRVMSEKHLKACVEKGVCWVCGDPLGKFMAFVIGPMCAVTRTNSEPPSHRECAVFSAMACPFLTRPHAKRRVVGLPEDTKPPAGISIDRNPGAAAVWVTQSAKIFPDPVGRVLFEMGDPTEVLWFCQGRPALYEEVEESIRTGVPALAKMAEADGKAGLDALAHALKRVAPFLPRRTLVSLA